MTPAQGMVMWSLNRLRQADCLVRFTGVPTFHMDRVADNTLSASLMYVGYVHGQHHSTSLSAD